MKAGFLALAIVFSAPAAADEIPGLFTLTGVPADDVLNVRQSPRADAPILATIPPGPGKVEVVGLSPDGNWARVNADETAGWVARRYLSKVPGGLPWWQMQSGLRCLGTEPFWGLAISMGSLKALMTTPDAPPVKLTTRAIWPGSAAVPVGGISLEAGDLGVQAVISRAECSDGMSDRVYGLSATLLVSGAAIGRSAPLTGCCTLAP